MKSYFENCSNNSLGYAFLFTLVIKIVSAVASLFPRSEALMWFLSFVFPIIVMLVYVVYGWRKARGTELQQSYGDSCYYLGFLFTVASIIIALIDLGHKGQDVFTIDQVSIRFAAAMVTTLIGMAIRVWLVTFGVAKKQVLETDLHGVRATAQDGASFIIEANLQNLELLNKSLVNNLVATQQLYTDLVDLGGRIRSDLEENVKVVKDLSKEMLTETKSAMQGIFQESQTAFRETMAQQSQEISNLSKRLDEMVENSGKNVQKLFDASAQKLEQASQSSVDSLVKVSKAGVEELDGHCKQVSEELQRFITSMGETSRAVSDRLLTESLPSEQWKVTLNAISDRLNQVVADFEKNAGVILRATGDIGQIVESTRDSLGQSARKLKDDMQDAAKEFSQSSTDATRTSANFSANLEKDLQGLQSSISSVATQVQTLAEQIMRLEKALATSVSEANKTSKSSWWPWKS